MKIMCDTNIVLDVLLDQPPFVEYSARVLHLCENGTVEGYTTASCVTDIFYIVRKHLHSTEQGYHAIEKLLDILNVCDVTSGNVYEALARKAPDFEDCLVATCAKSIQCECIVSRDSKGFQNCGLPVLTPEEFLIRLP